MNNSLRDSSHQKEISSIETRYDRRKSIPSDRYHRLRPSVYMCVHERERRLAEILRKHADPVSDKKVLEIGCGSGGNLMELIQLGFTPGVLVGNELLKERASKARKRLPADTKIVVGDAAELDFPDYSFDIVYQSTVFTSILDVGLQQKLAANMWRMTKPGGGVIWYDFVYDNPRNPDVKGVSTRRIQRLFPHATLHCMRVTLAPPLARFVTRVHPSLYTLFNVFPFLRTHVLCWLEKRE